MISFRKPANPPRSEGKVISKGLGAAQKIVRETGEALLSLTGWERTMHVFWLLGPFILLIERSPADLWLSVIALTFAGRSIARREGWWLRVTWVRLAFLFWAACLALGMTPHVFCLLLLAYQPPVWRSSWGGLPAGCVSCQILRRP